MEYEPIRHVWINHDNDLVDLTVFTQIPASHVFSETLHTNKKHPFLTVEQGFIPVAQLKLGMHVIEAGGQVGVVTGWKSVPGVQVMYNLEVAQDHTFTVDAGQWVVHNACFPSRNAAFRQAKRDAGISMSQHPDRVYREVLVEDGVPRLDENNQLIKTRNYQYGDIVIQEHSAGHYIGQVGEQGPHFNVRPNNGIAGELRTGSIPGTLEHYSW